MSQHIQVDPKIYEQYATYHALGIRVKVPENTGTLKSMLRVAEDTVRSHPATYLDDHITLWREAYRSFGSKPSKYLSSLEALVKRVRKGEELPAINPLVDLYNSLSIQLGFPAGGDDVSKLSGRIELCFSNGTDTFGDDHQMVKPGEVIYRDQDSVTCRRWNWRQAPRSFITEETREAYFIFESLLDDQSRLFNNEEAILNAMKDSVKGLEILGVEKYSR